MTEVNEWFIILNYFLRSEVGSQFNHCRRKRLEESYDVSSAKDSVSQNTTYQRGEIIVPTLPTSPLFNSYSIRMKNAQHPSFHLYNAASLTLSLIFEWASRLLQLSRRSFTELDDTSTFRFWRIISKDCALIQNRYNFGFDTTEPVLRTFPNASVSEARIAR